MGVEPLRHELHLPVRPRDAFATWVSMGTWWPPAYSADPDTLVDVVVGRAVGEPVLLRHRGLGDVPFGAITRFEPPRRITQTFWLGLAEAAPTELDVTFTATDDGTAFVLTHGGWTPANQAQRPKFTDWPLILQAYADAL